MFLTHSWKAKNNPSSQVYFIFSVFRGDLLSLMLNNFSHLNLMGRQIGLYFEDPRTFVYFNWLKV